MLKVECESCKAPYQIDERRVPATGLKMRCPKCGHSFLVTLPNAGAPAVDARDLDLPSRPDDNAALPSPKVAPPRPAPPQIRKKSVVPPALDFGDPDLPGLSSDAALPSPKKSEPKAPAKLDFDLELPSPRTAPRAATPAGTPAPGFAAEEADLPSAPANLPAARRMLDFGDPELPSLSDSFPSVATANNLPSNREFGEVDLPSVSDSAAGIPSAPNRFDFGELELPGAESDSAVPTVSAPGRAASGTALPDIEEASRSFDEMDLGGKSDAPPMAIESAKPSGEAAIGNEAQIEVSKKRPRVGTDAKDSKDGASRRFPLPAALAVLVILGGGALQLTPVGAFGYIAISDLVSSGKYKDLATNGSAAARKAFGADLYPSNRVAADELARLHGEAPRARALAAAAAFYELSNQVRFGADSDRAAKAKAWLSEIPKGADVSYLDAARGAEHASQGEYAEALARLDKAKEHDKGDPIASDLEALRGDVLLAQNNPKGAAEAFLSAQALMPSARAQFGIARAKYAMRDYAKASEAALAAQKLSPGHVGSTLLLAAIAWAKDRNDGEVVKSVNAALEASQKASPRDLAFGYALRGWMHAAKDRMGDARADFEKAVKLDPKNVSALVGQGELFYVDGRLTEALPRFDEAIRFEDTNVDAIVGSAKSKIGLERLNDAKIQLSAALAKAPKSMMLTMWLGKAEEALGNRKAAEERYAAATQLVDPGDKDAVLPYAALAALLASNGRPEAAREKLEEAQKKLPDSVALRRSLGDVALVEGRYDDAVNQFQEGLKKDPADVSTHFKLGVVMRKLRKLTEASEEFDKVQAVDKDYPGLTLERGLLFEQSGDLQKALDLFKSAYEKAPADLDLTLRVGAAYVAVGRPDEALPLIKKVLELRPNSAEANHYMGRANFAKGGLESASAMRYLTRAVELDANRPEYHLYVAWAANDASPAQLGVARSEVDKALALDKLFADAYWQRGVVERKEGAIEDALRDLKRALELKPNRIEAHAALAECYEEKNDAASALAEWAKAIAANGNEAYWRYKYGRLLLERNNAKEAADHLAFAVDSAAKVQPRPGWLVPAEFLAGEALRKAGKKAEAIPHYKNYLLLSPPTAPDRKDATTALAQLGAAVE